jgi:predicted ATPase
MTLELKNIGMIKEASVKIDGLTVIAGENDTGKSTVGKFLYLSIKHELLLDEEENTKSFFKRFFKSKSMIKVEDIFNSEEVFHDSFESSISYDVTTRSLKDIIFIESPLVWNFTDFFRDIAQVESQMRIELDYPYLMKDLNFKLHIKNASEGIDIKKKMTDLMGGEFKKDDMGRYYFDKQGQRIELLNTATGIKYFALFQVLSQNNYLNEDTVLILDEPEVHLHPKWQLEMAKVIVDLVKNGVKIVVNSHSPYMIEALELYAKKEDISRNFYLAKKEDEYSTILDVSDNLEAIYQTLAEPIATLEEQSLENFKW